MKKNLLFSVITGMVVVSLVLSGCASVVQGQSPEGTPSLAPVKAEISLMAEDKVVPPRNAKLSFSTSGVIDQVLVEVGRTVQAGEPLLRLKGNEQLQASVANAELELLSAQQTLDGLYDGIDLERAEVMALVAEARKELDKATKKSYSKDYQRGGQDQIDTARANYIIAQKDFEDAEEMYNGVRGNDDQSVAAAEALTFLAAARQKRDSALANLNYLMLKPNELDVAQIDSQLALAQAKLDDAQKKLNRLAHGPDAGKVELAEARLNNAQMQLSAAKSSLDDLELTAPFTGTIVVLDAEPGTFVQPGSVLVQLADVTNWVVETTDLTERNVGRIKTGMPATIRFDALPGVESIGRVERIDQLGQNFQGDIVYTVRLKLDQPDPRLLWNMTASVTFVEE